MTGPSTLEIPIDGSGDGRMLPVVEPHSTKARSRKAARTLSQKPKVRDRKGGTRTAKLFPTFSFQESLVIAEAIQAHSGGTGKIRRLTLFDAIKKSPDSGPSRMLVTNSSKYGLTIGGYRADYLELTPKGNLATNPEADPKEKFKARVDLAVTSIAPFKSIYDRFVGNKLPAKAVMRDTLQEAGVPNDDLEECADAFIVNVKYLGLLKTVAGAERLLAVDHALEEMPSTGRVVEFPIAAHTARAETQPASSDTSDWAKICFYITPIGDEGTSQRQHSDLFLNYVVEPAIATLKLDLKIVRADLIGKSGMIGPQIMEHVLRSRLVIVDLSFHNPNVFYELCLRHVSGLPTVHIIRLADNIPFDIQQCRTIQIDTTDIFSLVPKLETYKSEIAQQARRALEIDNGDNPVTVYFPDLKLTIPELISSKTGSGKVM